VATSGSLQNPGQRDWLAVALTANQPYEITIAGLSANADYPTLGTAAGLASDGTFVAWQTGDGVPSPFGAATWYLYFLPTVSGTYYIDVYAARL